MKMIARFFVVLGAFAVIATGAIAADDPIKARQELMKSVGDSTKLSAQMVKGKMPFDSLTAEDAMQTIADVPDKYVTLFPSGSDKGETEAAPRIWEDMAGFKAAAEKLKTAALNGVKAAGNGEAAFKAAFGELVKNCKGCHQDYRIKKEK